MGLLQVASVVAQYGSRPGDQPALCSYMRLSILAICASMSLRASYRSVIAAAASEPISPAGTNPWSKSYSWSSSLLSCSLRSIKWSYSLLMCSPFSQPAPEGWHCICACCVYATASPAFIPATIASYTKVIFLLLQ